MNLCYILCGAGKQVVHRHTTLFVSRKESPVLTDNGFGNLQVLSLLISELVALFGHCVKV